MSKLFLLRKKLSENKLDGYLIPMRDEFGCEYVPAQNRRLEYVTGFTGSNGFLVVTKTKAAFFTDGRYTLQAKLQLDANEFDILDLAYINEVEWICDNFKKTQVIGYDPKLFPVSGIKKLEEKCDEKNIKLIEIEKNLVDEIWKERPKAVETKAFVLDKKFAGKSSKEKIKEISQEIKGDFLLLTSSESICWLLNIRANDLPNTPVLLSFAILSKNGEVYLYANTNALGKIENQIEAEVYIRDLKDIYPDLKLYSGKKVELDPSLTPVKFKNILEKSKCETIENQDPCLAARAIKNPIEIENLRKSHIRDGAALSKFFNWIENNYNEERITEVSAAEKLAGFRKQNKNFYSLSFDSIIGWNKNGAIIHYRADEKSDVQIKGNGILLVDSGAQYFDGTTDVTRTIALGKPTSEQKKNFTLVLKGHIAIAKQKFLKGTGGASLDVLARRFLWDEGLDYKHGTGHGVGYFLNVHEGPHGISKVNLVPLKSGMIISNEPGYYKEGEYGIRIESLVLVNESENRGFYEFETLTKAPIDKNLVIKEMLTQEEIDWLNNYHDDVYNCVSPLLNNEENDWLKEATEKL